MLEPAIWAEHDVGSDHTIRSDECSRANFGSRINNRTRVNFSVAHLLHPSPPAYAALRRGRQSSPLAAREEAEMLRAALSPVFHTAHCLTPLLCRKGKVEGFAPLIYRET